jgi:NADH-quinone oxidoreductase subunit N
MFCCILVSFKFLQKEKFNSFEYNLLILFSILGLLCFISSYDLVAMFLALEVQSLSFYILATLKKESAFSTEAGLKYFILGALSSGFLLFGISLIYGITGTTNYEALAKLVLNFDYSLLLNKDIIFNFEYTERLILGLIFLMTGFFFKMAAAPFHL